MKYGFYIPQTAHQKWITDLLVSSGWDVPENTHNFPELLLDDDDRAGKWSPFRPMSADIGTLDTLFRLTRPGLRLGLRTAELNDDGVIFTDGQASMITLEQIRAIAAEADRRGL